jgi:mannitol/fructose-specific phosphotransferase system IIA component (Ntr-type)
MSVTQVTVPSGHDLAHCIPDLRSRKKEAALAEMVMAARELGVVMAPDLLLELLRLRERLGNTSLGKGVALPQARSNVVRVPRVIVARSSRGIDWGADDEIPVTLAMLVLAPAEWSDDAYYGLISRTASATRLQRTRQKLLGAETLDALGVAWREAAS